MKTGDWVRFKGGTELFRLEGNVGDDKLLCHDSTGRILRAESQALEVVYSAGDLSPTEIAEMWRSMDERLSKSATKGEVVE